MQVVESTDSGGRAGSESTSALERSLRLCNEGIIRNLNRTNAPVSISAIKLL